MAAAKRGFVSTMRILLGAGADPNTVSHDGLTPLALAAGSGWAPAVQELLHAGANPSRAAPGGILPVMYAAQTGSVAAVATILDYVDHPLPPPTPSRPRFGAPVAMQRGSVPPSEPIAVPGASKRRDQAGWRVGSLSQPLDIPKPVPIGDGDDYVVELSLGLTKFISPPGPGMDLYQPAPSAAPADVKTAEYVTGARATGPASPPSACQQEKDRSDESGSRLEGECSPAPTTAAEMLAAR